MFSNLLKIVALTGMLLGGRATHLKAQVIFLGGNNDGFAKSSYVEPDPSSDIFVGGINDGFAKSSYAEPDPSSDIYRGGINDGFANNSYIEPDPANDIYRGGVNDGFAVNRFTEPDPAGDIYDGGIDDGFAKAFFSEELALPVEWKYFSVTKNNGKPLLRWSADNEANCSRYEVMRSSDAKIFEAIGEVKCLGKINNQYEFEDASPLWHQVYYYKIAQYDINGESDYSDVKAFVTIEPSQPEVYYRSGQLIVRSEREGKLRSVGVYDFTGRTLCFQLTDVGRETIHIFDCQLAPNQLIIIHLRFDSFSHSTHMRIWE